MSIFVCTSTKPYIMSNNLNLTFDISSSVTWNNECNINYSYISLLEYLKKYYIKFEHF